MKDYYLFTKGEERGPYSRSQLQSMWQSGAVTSNSVYWHEGMIERRRVSELFEASTTPDASVAISAAPPSPRPMPAATPIPPAAVQQVPVPTKAIRSFAFAPFVLALLCFLLPFLEVSCQGHRMVALTGTQMITGTEIKSPVPFGPPKKVHVDAEPLAVLALSCVVIGLGVCFLKDLVGELAATICATVGFLFLMALRSKLDDDILRNGKGLVSAEYCAGFYLECLFLLVAAGLNGFLLQRFFARKQSRTSL